MPPFSILFCFPYCLIKPLHELILWLHTTYSFQDFSCLSRSPLIYFPLEQLCCRVVLAFITYEWRWCLWKIILILRIWWPLVSSFWHCLRLFLRSAINAHRKTTPKTWPLKGWIFLSKLFKANPPCGRLLFLCLYYNTHRSSFQDFSWNT